MNINYIISTEDDEQSISMLGGREVIKILDQVSQLLAYNLELITLLLILYLLCYFGGILELWSVFNLRAGRFT